jgi:hypothetical protein
MSSALDTDIANDALALIGEKSIVSLADNSVYARLAKQLLPQAVRQVLRYAPWRCARRRVLLSPLADAPAFGWRHQFQLPADCVRVVSLVGSGGCDGARGYEVEGRLLLANVSAAPLVYVSDFSGDFGQLTDADPLVRGSIVYLLACHLAWAVTEKRTLKADLWNQFQQTLTEAIRAGLPEEELATPWPAADEHASEWLPIHLRS